MVEVGLPDTVLVTGIALIVGCALGWLAAWLVWRRRAAGLNQRICTLRAALKGQETRLLDARLCLREREATAEWLRSRVGQNEDMIRSLTDRIEEQRQAMDWLDLAVRERDGCIRALRAQIGETEPWTGDLPSLREGKRGNAVVKRLGVMMREYRDRSCGEQARVGGNRRHLVDLNTRLVDLVWELDASSKRPYGAAPRNNRS